MILKVYSVYDAKAHAFMQPFFMMNEPLAIRTFANAINKRDSQLGVNPEDYTLHACGEFDDSSGEFLVEAPKLVCSGLQVRKPDESQ